MRYKPSRDIPRFVRKYRTFSPSKLRDIVLRERNKDLSPEAFTHWFGRHPEITKSLQDEIIEKELTKSEVSESIFENGTFEELPTVKTWINEMHDRVVAPKGIKRNTRVLKRICRGKYTNWGLDLVDEGFQPYLHPDRLTLEDFQRIEREIRKRGFDTNYIRIPARNFLTSKGIVVGTKISGSKSRGFGKYADLHVDINVLKQILDELEILDYQAYAIDLFMFKTASRITATINAKIESYHSDLFQINVIDKGRHKTPEKRKKRKYVDPQLGEVLNKIIGERKAGAIFTKDKREMAEINKSLITKYCPQLVEKYPNLMWNHFWRHMFAQHMLRATNWNYAVVANLGGWTIKALEESYGKPPVETVKEWGIQYAGVLSI